MSLKDNRILQNIASATFLAVGAMTNMYALHRLKLSPQQGSKLAKLIVGSGVYYLESTIYDAIKTFSTQDTNLVGKVGDEIDL